MQQTTRENEMFRCRLQGQSQLCCNNHTSGYLLSQSFISRDWHVAFRQANNNKRKKITSFFLFGVWSIQQKLNWNYAQQKLELVVYAVIVKIHNTRTANNILLVGFVWLLYAPCAEHCKFLFVKIRLAWIWMKCSASVFTKLYSPLVLSINTANSSS